MSKQQEIRQVIVIGGGFAGVAACLRLRNVRGCQVELIDRNNYHLFQPLLYQVAMAGLNPGDIATPLRRLFSSSRNISVKMAEVEKIALDQQRIFYDHQWRSYDYLILACGAKHYYFGHEDWEEHAPGLKTIEQATEIRRRILTAFEMAEKTPAPTEQAKWLTFVVVGGGPTGVEMAGAIAEMSAVTLKKDYCRADLSKTRVILAEAGPRVLAGFPDQLSNATRVMLERLGVEVKLNCLASNLTETTIQLGDQIVESQTKIWAAGVHPAWLVQTVETNKDRVGRLLVEPDLSLPGHSNVFAVGDLSALLDKQGNPLPGIAPVAIQQGKYVGNQIRRDLKGRSRRPFRYYDKGMMATVGRSKAVVSTHGINFSGFFAWLVWALVHVVFLIEFKNRFFVFLQWSWAYFSFGRGARLIVQKHWRFYDQDRTPATTTELQPDPDRCGG